MKQGGYAYKVWPPFLSPQQFLTSSYNPFPQYAL